ncbi:hypothetical protein ABKN59_002380 [Abortiporus biennis]
MANGDEVAGITFGPARKNLAPRSWKTFVYIVESLIDFTHSPQVNYPDLETTLVTSTPIDNCLKECGASVSVQYSTPDVNKSPVAQQRALRSMFPVGKVIYPRPTLQKLSVEEVARWLLCSDAAFIDVGTGFLWDKWNLQLHIGDPVKIKSKLSKGKSLIEPNPTREVEGHLYLSVLWTLRLRGTQLAPKGKIFARNATHRHISFFFDLRRETPGLPNIDQIPRGLSVFPYRIQREFIGQQQLALSAFVGDYGRFGVAHRSWQRYSMCCETSKKPGQYLRSILHNGKHTMRFQPHNFVDY